MGGRIQDVEVDPRDPSTIYVGAAAGGIWKTTNHGTTWTPIFEGQNDNSFGDIAIFPGDSKIIWAGTGEQNNRQCYSWGGGVYRYDRAGARFPGSDILRARTETRAEGLAARGESRRVR